MNTETTKKAATRDDEAKAENCMMSGTHNNNLVRFIFQFYRILQLSCSLLQTKHLIKFIELLQQWRTADNDVESFTEQKYDGKWNLGIVNHSCKLLLHFIDDDVAGN